MWDLAESPVSIALIESLYISTRDVRVLKSQRRIDINYVDELMVNQFFEPSFGPSDPELS